MSGSGKSGNNRRNRQRYSGKKDDNQKHNRKKRPENLFSDGRFERERLPYERLRWSAPTLPANPITTPECPWCGKQIKDITTAVSDRDTGIPVHFDCVLARIAEMEKLELNDTVCYIGGGRFGIVHYNNPPDTRDFTIKKIFEWEPKEHNYPWRRPISEYFSLT